MAVITVTAFPSPAFHTQLAIVDALLKPSPFPTCDFEYPESFAGSGNGYPCTKKATVHELATGLDYCGGHFPEVPLA